ncbi:hypothetical protein KM92DES2_12295 [uncultured Desulfovibrio sp.]|uniref:Uncharacterized protein n=1 Tax=uncultured Desulfovibrio sp. TaxID=167968 RepID=A0A212K6L2_9BACT|nr:hypothetical protein KM92DES2_12295 [uncultured Desulfovibrio sp.]
MTPSFLFRIFQRVSLGRELSYFDTGLRTFGIRANQPMPVQI